MEQRFQYVSQKLMQDKSLDSFAAHFSKIFNEKQIPQQFREIMSFKIFSKVNLIGWMKTWGK